MEEFPSNNSCSASDSSYSYGMMYMTEEEAMAIWLRRNEEIGERVRRRDEARRRRAAEHQHMPASCSEEQAAAAALRANKEESSDGESSGSNDINSGFQYAAAFTHSDAWIRAISTNVMGPYDPHNPNPSYHKSYHA